MRFALFVLASLTVAACADAPEPDALDPDVAEVVVPSPSRPDRAVATIAEVDGSGLSGTVEFVDIDDAVEIRYNLSGFTSQRLHGFHIHQNGSCEPDSTGTPAGAAGGHFNPLASEHGAPSNAPANRHAGDLGNIEPEATSVAIGTRIDSVLAFSGPTSIIGKAVIVHAGTDDLVSQPSGDAGSRIGCGIIRNARDMPAPEAPAAE